VGAVEELDLRSVGQAEEGVAAAGAGELVGDSLVRDAAAVVAALHQDRSYWREGRTSRWRASSSSTIWMAER
jgi:hypothetical protein